MPVPSVRVFCRQGFVVVLALPAMSGVSAAADEGEEVWPSLRASLFGARPIAEAPDAVRLTAPGRAEDAAVVPLAIVASTAPGAAPVQRILLVIDRNPSPVAAVFGVDDRVPVARIETRVRVEDYTVLRAIVERTDGSLQMATRFIKAAGGCSAPVNKRTAEGVTLGQMRWQGPDPDGDDGIATVALQIRHPNRSGLAMDPVTRLYDPPYFVREVRVTFAGRQVFRADVDFSISENPIFRFGFRADGPGDLQARVLDTEGSRFESVQPVATPGR